MKVVLAGFNVDAECVRELSVQARAMFSPETITAAYARISHSSESIEALRRSARRAVEKARQSNQAIILEQQHGSVSEHAVFNFDISGISRLAAEALESFRLASYTERSQRFVPVSDEFLIPEEIRQTPWIDEFVKLVESQYAYYHQLRERLLAHFTEKYPELAGTPEGRRRLETIAREDARYVTSLACQTHLGLSVNSRSLRHMLRRFASHQLVEVRRLGELMYEQVRPVAPSLVTGYAANDFDRRTAIELQEFAKRIAVESSVFKRRVSSDVELVDYTLNADNKVLAALLFGASAMSYEECLRKASKMIMNQRRELFKTACQFMDVYNLPAREFEYVGLTFDLVVSAACFAQLKRHRMITLTAQHYNPSLGVTVPPSIEEIRELPHFREAAARCLDLYDRVAQHSQVAAQYVLSNAHQRRALVSVNARELYHITRLREDKTAQWDIRDKTRKMVELAKHIMPLTLLLAGGKDQYPTLYQELYGRPLPVSAPVQTIAPTPKVESQTPHEVPEHPRAAKARASVAGKARSGTKPKR